MSACSEPVNAECPRPQEILDLSYWNTSDDLVREAHDIWSTTYEQVCTNILLQNSVLGQPNQYSLPRKSENAKRTISKDNHAVYGWKD